MSSMTLDGMTMLRDLSCRADLKGTWIYGLLTPYESTLEAHKKVNRYGHSGRNKAECLRLLMATNGIKIPKIPGGITETRDRIQKEHPLLNVLPTDHRGTYIKMVQKRMDLEQEVARLREKCGEVEETPEEQPEPAIA